MFFNEDDRAQRFIDVFEDLPGQVNVSFVHSTDHIVAWHKHNIQTDLWTCLKGSFKVGLAYPQGDGYRPEWEYHGYKALQKGSILCYYVTEKYNPEDEIRAKVGDFGEEWEAENK